MTRAVVLLVALAGCDKLFDLDHLSPGTGDDSGVIGDGHHDGSDGSSCMSTGHDEDGDENPDDCDPCPTFLHLPGTGDMDTDGLPDECDRNDSATGDKILAYWTFPEGTTTGLATQGTFIYDSANTIWNINAMSSMATMSMYAWRRVDFHVSGIGVIPAGSVVTVRAGINELCALTGGSGSVTVRVGSMTGLFAKAGTFVRRISVSNDGTRLHCDLSDNSVTNGGASEPGSPQTSTVGIYTDSTSNVHLEAIVIYGVK